MVAGKPSITIRLTPTPGAEEGRQKLHGRLLEAAAEAAANLIGLLSKEDQGLAHQSLLPYLSHAAAQQPFAVVQDSQGKVTLGSIRDRLINHPDPAIRSVLTAYWNRIARELQLDSFGEDWEELSPVIENPPASVNPPLFQFAALEELTGRYPMDAQLRGELMRRAKEAESASGLGLLSQKNAALSAYLELVKKNAGVRIAASDANALVHLAASL